MEPQARPVQCTGLYGANDKALYFEWHLDVVVLRMRIYLIAFLTFMTRKILAL